VARVSTSPLCTAREETWGGGETVRGSQRSTFPMHWDPLVRNLQSVHEEGEKYSEGTNAFFCAELLTVLLRFKRHLLWASFLCAN